MIFFSIYVLLPFLLAGSETENSCHFLTIVIAKIFLPYAFLQKKDNKIKPGFFNCKHVRTPFHHTNEST